MSRRFVDLSLPIHDGMPTFPSYWHPFVEINLLGRHGIEGRETRKLLLGTHTGTHCDAPRHFVPEGLSVDKLSLEALIGPARVLDFSYAQPYQKIDVKDLEQQLGSDCPERILLRFDWSKHWGKREYYSNHPFISRAAAQWLVDKGIRLLGMDTPTPDNPENGFGSELDSPVHKILLSNGVVLVEYLCNLASLQQTEFTLIVLPLKIINGDGAPARCVAIEI
ncbi:cyclase family protein [Desulfonauticus submarinus]